MLLNIVKLRYADPPTFLDTTQVISGYSMQRNGTFTMGGTAAAGAIPGPQISGTIGGILTENPTITYQPLNGQQYAENIIRPIAPAVIMPLSLGGMPIDMLLRLTAQSIDGLSNVSGLGAGPAGGGSVRFYLLLHDLRQLQEAGALTIRVVRTSAASGGDASKGGSGKSSSSGDASSGSGERVYLVFGATPDSDLQATESEVRRLLHLDPDARETEVIYGPYPKSPGQMAILTRSMLAMLTQLSYEVDVPKKDVDSGRTVPTIGQVGIENRPQVIIHSGKNMPWSPYVSVTYRGVSYWIDDTDYQSKEAFTMIQVLSNLATTSQKGGAVVTIPVG
ncbi:hypothetical protein FAI40_07360 [Acetobacteraceae bacterium]|nr:hypothetical protein FAI40_07360 [Acetobacteraceae bacterium]